MQPAVEPAPWSLSLAYGQFTADLVFDEFVGLEVEQHMVVAGVSHAFEGGWRLGGTVGASLAGSLRGEDHRLTFRPGFVASFLAAVTFLEAEGYRPFFESTLTVSVSWATLRDEVGASSPWVALDFRLGATAGWRVHDVWVPYLAVRFFGGPVFWRDGSTDRVGTDRHHFQLAIGSTVTLWNVDLFVEWALPVGESGLSLGLGYRF
ncbi:MAG: hypothetical protein QF464_11230 [Myxococcota bacterium]|nr:hypothetical protein [Myxococcota bacterium]